MPVKSGRKLTRRERIGQTRQIGTSEASQSEEQDEEEDSCHNHLFDSKNTHVEWGSSF